MRRVLAVVVGISLLFPLATSSAHATKERYRSQSVNAFWHSKLRVDRDTYLKITWYAGVYQYDDELWSDLYRSVTRCERRTGRDRCRGGRSWYGDITELGEGSFAVDRRLRTAHLEATYPLFTVRHHRRVAVGPTHIVVDFQGVGDILRTTESYSTHQGCTVLRYRGRWLHRDALATGNLSIGSDPATDLGETSDANASRGEAIEVRHEC